MKSAHRLLQLRLLLAIALVLGSVMVGSVPVSAQTGTVTSTATPSDATPQVGDTITVTISVDMTGVNAPDNYLGSYTASIAWDPAILDYVSNGGLPAGFTGVVNVTNADAGTITFNGANAAGATGSLTVLTITFDVVGSGISDLDLEYSAMAAATTFANLLPLLTVTDGQVEASPAPYTLTMVVDPVGGGTTQPAVGAHAYDIGSVVPITATAASGYLFDHWTGDVANVNSPTTMVTIDASKTITAHFTVITHELTIAVDPVGGGTTEPAVGTHTYDEGSVVPITATAASGYAFDYWTGDVASADSPTTTVTIDASKTITAHFVDITLPDTSITSSPENPSNSADASFGFISTEPGSTFECQLDGGGFSACTSPKTYTGLADGDHTFAARAIDADSNVDPSPASYSWTIDTVAPDTSITAYPPNPSHSVDASFSFTSTEPGSTFECQLDGGGFSTCTSPHAYTGLDHGDHTFEVRAIDGVGNVGTTASYSWTINWAVYLPIVKR